MTGYFYTQNAIFDTPMSGAAKLVYAYLSKCANNSGRCYPSHKAIAAAAGISVSTVKKALPELADAKLVHIQGQARSESGCRTNIYTIVKNAVRGYFVTYGSVFVTSLTAKARLVYLYFCRLASGRDSAFPSHKTTVAACRLSVAGTRLAIDELETSGLISRLAQYRENGGQRANLYTLIRPQDGDDGTEDCSGLNGGRQDSGGDGVIDYGGDGTRSKANDNSADNRLNTIPHIIRKPECLEIPTVITDIVSTYTEVIPLPIEAATPCSYSSSNCTLSSSGKSGNCKPVIPKSCDMRCSVRSPELFVFPLIILSSIDCVRPESVASLLMVIPCSRHKIAYIKVNSFLRAPLQTGDSLLEAEDLVRLHTECAGNSVDGDDGQTVDCGAFQVADRRVAEIRLFGQLQLAHSAFLAEELNLEPYILQESVLFLGVCLSADWHSCFPLDKLSILSLSRKGLHMNAEYWYNIVVVLQLLCGGSISLISRRGFTTTYANMTAYNKHPVMPCGGC